MTISTTINRADYTGGGGVTDFPFLFLVLDSAHLKVYADDELLTEAVHYTVSGIGNLAGGTVTFLAAPDGQAVAIIREVPATQETDYVENDSFPAETHERALDKLTMIAQQQSEALARAPKLSPTSAERNISLADLAGNAGKFLRVNSTVDGYDYAEVAAEGTVVLPLAVVDGGTGQTTIAAARDALHSSEDSRTNTVADGETVKVTTSGAPAAGIGVATKYVAESADENPSELGKSGFAFSDIGAGSEDSYFLVQIRRAGAALAEAFRFIATGTAKAIFSHNNAADRTYTLPDASTTLVGHDTTQTLSGKTLSGAVVSGAAPSTPAANVLYLESTIKAWLRCDAAGNILSDLNVASIVDVGTGELRVNFATAITNPVPVVTLLHVTDWLLGIVTLLSSTQLECHVIDLAIDAAGEPTSYNIVVGGSY